MKTIYLDEFTPLEKYICESCDGVTLVPTGDYPAGWVIGLYDTPTRCPSCRNLPPDIGYSR